MLWSCSFLLVFARGCQVKDLIIYSAESVHVWDINAPTSNAWNKCFLIGSESARQTLFSKKQILSVRYHGKINKMQSRIIWVKLIFPEVCPAFFLKGLTVHVFPGSYSLGAFQSTRNQILSEATFSTCYAKTFEEKVLVYGAPRNPLIVLTIANRLSSLYTTRTKIKNGFYGLTKFADPELHHADWYLYSSDALTFSWYNFWMTRVEYRLRKHHFSNFNIIICIWRKSWSYESWIG